MHPSKYAVDSDLVAQHGLDVGTIAGQIQTAMNLMDRKLTALQGTWTGSAATQYAVLHGEWQRAQIKMKDSLAEIGRTLGTASRAYSTTESDVKAAFMPR